MTPSELNIVRKLVDSIRVDKPDDHLYQLSTARFEIEVMITEDSTHLKVWEASTGRDIFALGWPYQDDDSVNASIVDVIAELGSLVKLARDSAPPEIIH